MFKIKVKKPQKPLQRSTSISEGAEHPFPKTTYERQKPSDHSDLFSLMEKEKKKREEYSEWKSYGHGASSPF
jgi:hypothetical protein